MVMSLRKLPKAKTFERPMNFQWDAPSDVLAKWSGSPMAAEADDPNTISIYDVIGEDSWTGEGFTAKRMGAALRSIGNNPVTVKLNSPGGDMFEGIAIYNMLREHPAQVNVEVLGIAASAASIIAMAGDEITMGLGTFLMIHNAWGMVIGNRHDMRDAATLFDSFDAALADIYEARTGMSRNDIEAAMDAETFMAPSEAVSRGFADSVSDELKKPEVNNSGDKKINAKRRMDALLAQSGVPRVERRKMLNEVAGGTQDAASTVTQDADLDMVAVMQLIHSMKP